MFSISTLNRKFGSVSFQILIKIQNTIFLRVPTKIKYCTCGRLKTFLSAVTLGFSIFGTVAKTTSRLTHEPAAARNAAACALGFFTVILVEV